MKNLSLFDKEDLKEAILEVILPLIQDLQQNSLRTNTTNEGDLMTRKEAAAYLKITLPTLWEWTRQGTIRRKPIRGRVYYFRSELEKLTK